MLTATLSRRARIGPARTWLFLTAAMALAMFEPVLLRAAGAGPDNVIRSSDDFWGLAGDARDVPHPLQIECRINFYDRSWRNLWIETNGHPGYLPISEDRPDLHSGQRVRITGTVTPARGLAASEIHIEVLDAHDATPPEPLDAHLRELTSLDRHRVSIEGWVDLQLLVDETHLRLAVLNDNRSFVGWVLLQPGQPIPNFKNQRVRMDAVYSMRVDPSATQLEVELWSPGPDDVHVLNPIARDPMFATPTRRISELLNVPNGETVHVRGRVQSQQPGVTVVIRDPTGQILVETMQQQRFAAGSLVDAVGVKGSAAGVSAIESALLQPVPNSSPPRLPSDPSAPLTLVEQVRQLAPEEAASGRKVHLAGVVTWSQPDFSYLFLQDVSGGIRVRFKPNSIIVPVIGKSIAVDGYTFDTGPSPAVELERLVDQGAMRLPQFRSVSYAEAMTGSAEAQWVEMQGFLREAEVVGQRTRLDLTTPGGEFTAVIQTPEPGMVHEKNALVRIRGVCETTLDERRRVVGFTLWVPYIHNIYVDEEGPSDVFSTPLRSLASLRTLSVLGSVVRTRVAGIVVHQDPQHYIFLEDSESGLLVLTHGQIPLVPGDRVEAVGLVGREGDRAVLRDAVYRKTGEGAAPLPFRINDPSRIYDGLDGRLVTMRGLLINQLVRPESLRFTLQSGEALFETRLDQRGSGLPAYALGTGLEVTGIYRLVSDDSRQSRGFQLLLRSPADVAVYQKPELWTVRRLIMAAGILAGCLLLGIAWVTALRRRLHRQTAQIRSQLQKEVVLEDRHRGIVENASDFIFTADLEGRFTSINPAGERMTGFARDVALRMNFREMLVADSDHGSKQKPEFIPAADGTVTFQSQLRTRDGRLIWVETSTRLVRDSGSAVGLLGIVRDISDRKQIEEELKRARDAAEANTRAKSEFLANMSHEIRTPMNAVIGMSNLLLDTRLDERQRDFAETIRNGAEALLTILNDILDFSKMEAGRLEIETVDFDVRDTVEAAVELLGARAVAKDLELTAFVPSRLCTQVRGDPSRLRQVLLNLLGNALKFTERGEVILQVSLESENEQELRFLFEIIDTGVGISAEEQARLFRPFTQADTSTTRRFGGTGLGLAITKQIVDLLDGRCGVRSQLGEGSTFWFTAKFSRPLAPKPSAKVEPAAAGLRGLKVLLVDDSSTSCRLMDHYASHWGVRTTDANSGGEALRLLAAAASGREPFSIAVIDAKMPGMDGLQLARAIRLDPTYASLRIVILASLDRPVMPAEMQDLGLDASVLKPVRQSEFLLALTRAHPAGEAVPATNHDGVNHSMSGSASFLNHATHGPTSSIPPVSLKILLAEDNTVNQRVALLQLQKLGHRAQPAANGIEVLKCLEQADYDVILMDCHMPELDGFEATRRIRQHPTHGKIRIIALTANAMQGDREKCLAAGMDDYLSKPVRVAELQAALARCYPVRET